LRAGSMDVANAETLASSASAAPANRLAGFGRSAVVAAAAMADRPPTHVNTNHTVCCRLPVRLSRADSWPACDRSFSTASSVTNRWPSGWATGRWLSCGTDGAGSDSCAGPLWGRARDVPLPCGLSGLPSPSMRSVLRRAVCGSRTDS